MNEALNKTFNEMNQTIVPLLKEIEKRKNWKGIEKSAYTHFLCSTFVQDYQKATKYIRFLIFILFSENT